MHPAANPRDTRNRHVLTIRLVLTVLASLLSSGGSALWSQDVLRLTRNIPGDSKSVILYADQVATWLEGSERVILLRGAVLVEHGVLHARMPHAIAFVDQGNVRKTGILHVQLYTDAEVVAQNGADNRSGRQAILDLYTRGELKLKAYAARVRQEIHREDPLYGWATAFRAPPAAPVIQQTSAQQPAPGLAPPLPQPSPPPTLAPPISPVTPAPPVPAPRDSLPPPNPPALTPPPVPATPPLTGATPPPAPAAPPIPAPVPPPPTETTGPPPRAAPPPRQLSIRPRTTRQFDQQGFTLPTGEHVEILAGGVILNVRGVQGIGLLDIEADRLVVWTKENLQDMMQGMKRPEGQKAQDLEFYLAGNVEIRQVTGADARTLRADEVYYDVNRNVAVALRGDLEIREPRFPEPVHLRAEELLQLSPKQFRGMKAEVFSSRLPSDPGLKVYLAEVDFEQKTVPRRSIFGWNVTDRRTGQPASYEEMLVRGRSAFLEIEDVPVFYLPFVQGDARDPLGPLEGVNINADRIFGFQFMTSWNAYDILGIDPIPGTRWRFDVDYLSRRGPALGSGFDYVGTDFFGLPCTYNGLVKSYGLKDSGNDILGFLRDDVPHPEWRGRFLWRQALYDLPLGFTLQTQVAALSDKNFLEQYFKLEFDHEINQETFLYLKQQQQNWAWTVLAEPRLRDWVTETEWLPRADGYLIGQSFFDVLTYNVRANAGYARLRPTEEPPPPVLSTDVQTNTGRFDLWQELSAPFSLGAFRVVPYGVLDLTHYTRDLTGDSESRLYGGGGVRGSIPFSRLFPDAQSDLFNVNGINHKLVLGGNYYLARTGTPYSQLPQLDRLHDDATDQAMRDVYPAQIGLNPANAALLTTSPLYNPQVYAIRRLVANRLDTLDDIDVLQADLRQRWQTKRGYPGQQHVVDWMTLDVSASWFPNKQRDNFGESFAFVEYDWLWNVGDRTALVSSGWVDPIEHGPRVYTVGAYLDRPDRTTFFLGYRHIDPINSRAVTAAVGYVFSPKYAMSASSLYDFGTNQSLSNTLMFTRIGSDLSLSLGITYNALTNNFGVLLEILPNVVPVARRGANSSMFGTAALGRPQ